MIRKLKKSLNIKLSTNTKSIRRHKRFIQTGKRNYIKASLETRQELIHMIEEMNLTVKVAAEKLKVNSSIVKNITKI